VRKQVGKEAARRLRRAGLVPGVVYGGGEEAVAIQVAEKDLRRALGPGTHASLVNLTLLDDSSRTIAALFKGEQRHPTSGQILCVDFQRVRMAEKIRTEVPVSLKGTATGAKEGGIVQLILHSLLIECLPADLPQEIVVDVTPLAIGDSLTVEQIPPPAGVQLLTPGDEVVVHVAPPAKVVEEVAAAEPSEPELVSEKKAEREAEKEQG